MGLYRSGSRYRTLCERFSELPLLLAVMLAAFMTAYGIDGCFVVRGICMRSRLC